jgi:hypothetical protein
MRPCLYQPAQPAPDRDKPFACLEVSRAPRDPGPRARIRGASARIRPLLGVGAALPNPVMEACQHGVGSVDLVAGGGEVLPDRAEVGGPVEAVVQERGGLRLVLAGAGAGVFAQLGLEVRVDRSGFDEADQAVSEVWSRRVTRSTVANMEPAQPGEKPDSDGRIPFTFRIGVTGHRDLADPDSFRVPIDKALRRLKEFVPVSPRYYSDSPGSLQMGSPFFRPGSGPRFGDRPPEVGGGVRRSSYRHR